jgi:uncharacterized protein
MRHAIRETNELVCSRIAYVEAHAALARARAGSRLTGAEHERIQAAFERLWSRIAIVAVDEPLVDRAAALARAHVLRGYDAVHLAAAVQVAGGAPLAFACFDEELRTAAVREGLAPFPDGP